MVRPGTKCNHHCALRSFIKFAYRRFDYRSPSPENIIIYMEFLVETKNSPDTVSNYVSGVKMCLKKMRVPVHAFQDQLVQDALKAIASTVRYVPQPSKPIPHQTLEVIIPNISDPEEVAIKCFLVVSFSSVFRQSSIAPRSVMGFDDTRNLCRGDVVIKAGQVWLRHKWSKSEQSSLSSHELKRLPEIPGSVLCPTQAIYDMLYTTPTLSSAQPLFCFHNGGPIPLSYITKVWNSVIKKLRLPRREHTLHCLRKGGSDFINRTTGGEDTTQIYGRWRGKKAMSTYIRDMANDRACAAFKSLSSSTGAPKLRR